MKHFLWLGVLLLAASCKSGFDYNRAGFEKLDQELLSRFGKEAYYTDVQIVSNQETGDAVLITETNAPSSLKQEQWLRYQGGEWEKQANVSFTVEGGAPESYMFRIGREASAAQLGALLEQSKAALQQQHHIAEPVFVMATIRSDHKRTSKSDGIFYYVTLRDPKTQKDFIFKYDLARNLVNTPSQP